MDVTIYHYEKCGTCKKALKWLDGRNVSYTTVPIREQPPKPAELHAMLEAYDGEIKQLFNVSGVDYRALNLKEKLPEMSTDEAVALLAGNGNLIKRPFVTGPGIALVGFDPVAWEEAFDDAGF